MRFRKCKLTNHGVLVPFSELDIGNLAYGYGLLQLPKMPELKGQEIVNFSAVEIDPSSIPYRDKAREKQRQAKLLQEKKDTGSGFRPRNRNPKTVNCSWSKKKEKVKKKEVQKKRNCVKETKSNNRLKRKIDRLDESEIDELAKEARLVKKLKSGKISRAEFELQINDEDDIN